MAKKAENPLWFFIVLPVFFLGPIYLGGVLWDIYQNKNSAKTQYKKLESNVLFRQIGQVVAICFIFQLVTPLSFISLNSVEAVNEEVSGIISIIISLMLGGILFEKMLRSKGIHLTNTDFWKAQNLAAELKIAAETQKAKTVLESNNKEPYSTTQKPLSPSSMQSEGFVLKDNGARGLIICALIIIGAITFALTNPALVQKLTEKLTPVSEVLQLELADSY